MLAEWGQPSLLRFVLQLAFTRVHSGLALSFALLAMNAGVHAQNLPDAGSIQREIERQQQTRPPVPAPQAVPAAPAVAPTPDDERFTIRAFVIQGVTLIPQAEVQRVLTPWLGRPIQFSDLEQAKQAIADLYQKRGWFARPQIPEQEFQDDGDLIINVIEGRLGAVRIEKEAPNEEGQEWQPNRKRMLNTFTARQKAGEPLYMPYVERAISLLNETPGMVINASLTSGEAPGASDVLVTPQLGSLWNGSLTRDNAGSRSTGSVKDTLSVNLNNPEGPGDQFALAFMRSKGVNYKRLGYTLPVAYDGARLGLNVSSMRYRVLFPMSESDSSFPRGSSAVQGLSLSWPALRSATQNIDLSASYDRKHFVNELYDPENTNIQPLSDKRIHVVNASLSGDYSDAWGQGGITQWRLGWDLGHVDLSGNLQNQQQDQQGPQTQGYYERLSISLSRLQRVTATNTLWLNLQGQRSNKNLDSSEEFSLGGSQGVRAYPSAEASGDYGWLLTLEARQVLTPQWQWVIFYDHGEVRVNHQSYAGADGPTRLGLQGWGTSLSWSLPGRMIARMTWSRRIGDRPRGNAQTGLDSDGSLVLNRFWLSLTALF